MTSEFEDETFFFSPKNDDLAYNAVGRVASAWAMFEFRIEQAIWALAGIEDEIGACITAQVFSVPSLFKSYIALAKFSGLPERHLHHLNKMLSERVQPIGEKRN